MDKVKAIGLFRLQINGTLNIFNIYGQGVYLSEVANAIEEAALTLHTRLNMNGEYENHQLHNKDKEI